MRCCCSVFLLLHCGIEENQGGFRSLHYDREQQRSISAPHTQRCFMISNVYATCLPILNTADSHGVNGKHTRANITGISTLSLPHSLCILVCLAGCLCLSISTYLSVCLPDSLGLMRSYQTPLYTVARFKPFVLWPRLSALFTRL